MTDPRTLVIRPNVLYLGNPVLLITTRDPGGRINLAPYSCMWALGDTLVLGVSPESATGANLLAGSDLVVNVPGDDMWPAVEALADSTGRDPSHDTRSERPRYEPEKFRAAGLTAIPGELVDVPRVAECPMQVEARIEDVQRGEFLIVRGRALRVHVHEGLVDPATDRLLPERWQPLLYTFRHYRPMGVTRAVSIRAGAAERERVSRLPTARQP